MDPLVTKNGEKVRVLLVEDDLTLAEMYRQKFTMVNCDFLLANDGEEGLRKALQVHPDILLLDLALPKMNGLSVMQELRKDPWGNTLPIIILTNFNPSDEILDQVVKNQPAYYLLKANTVPDDVVEKVKDVLHIVS